MIGLDANADGIIECAQHNTLDADWYGPVAWLSSLYLAALRAGETMARSMNDAEFAATCRTIADRGATHLVERLWNGEYFIHRRDPAHPEALGSGEKGCEIDQVFGQHWAFQVGLGRIFDPGKCRTALASLWKYNFTPDVGPYRRANKPGRWYAMAGEAGLLMCTWPHGGRVLPGAGQPNAGFDGYFNECMTGFEYQAAGHMMWEGMTLESLAVARAIHDRYHPSRRNPFNEVECGDHYARARASYGVFTAAAGFSNTTAPRTPSPSRRASRRKISAQPHRRRRVGTYALSRTDPRRHAVFAEWGRLR